MHGIPRFARDDMQLNTMSKKIEETLYDKRTYQRHITKGTLAEGDYKEYLKSLPDDSKNAEAVKVFSEEENVLTFNSVEKSK